MSGGGIPSCGHYVPLANASPTAQRRAAPKPWRRDNPYRYDNPGHWD
jgi:hypothetical protein